MVGHVARVPWHSGSIVCCTVLCYNYSMFLQMVGRVARAPWWNGGIVCCMANYNYSLYLQMAGRVWLEFLGIVVVLFIGGIVGNAVLCYNYSMFL